MQFFPFGHRALKSQYNIKYGKSVAFVVGNNNAGSVGAWADRAAVANASRRRFRSCTEGTCGGALYPVESSRVTQVLLPHKRKGEKVFVRSSKRRSKETHANP